MTQTETVPTVRTMERDGKHRAFCNDCYWSCAWMDEPARDIKAARHLNMHRIARGLERLPVEEPAGWREAAE